MPMLSDDYAVVLATLRRKRDELDMVIRTIESIAPSQPCFVDLSRAPFLATTWNPLSAPYGIGR